MDKARRKTDKILADTERRIAKLYDSSPALRRIMGKMKKYLDDVGKKTKKEYDAYMRETDLDERRKLKKVYSDAVRKLTLDSKEYQKIVREMASELAKVNQQGLDISNGTMAEVCALNYNQVAVDCRRAGIKVNQNG